MGAELVVGFAVCLVSEQTQLREVVYRAKAAPRAGQVVVQYSVRHFLGDLCLLELDVVGVVGI